METAHLDFGNFPLDVPPVPGPGDLDGDGVVDRKDLDYWQAVYGATSNAVDATPGNNVMGGRSFLDWQRNVAPAYSLAAAQAESSVLPAVNLDGSPVGASPADDAQRSRRAGNLARDAAFSEASSTALPPRQHVEADASQDIDAGPVRSSRDASARQAAFGELSRSIVGQLAVGD